MTPRDGVQPGGSPWPGLLSAAAGGALVATLASLLVGVAACSLEIPPSVRELALLVGIQAFGVGFLLRPGARAPRVTLAVAGSVLGLCALFFPELAPGIAEVSAWAAEGGPPRALAASFLVAGAPALVAGIAAAALDALDPGVTSRRSRLVVASLSGALATFVALLHLPPLVGVGLSARVAGTLLPCLLLPPLLTRRLPAVPAESPGVSPSWRALFAGTLLLAGVSAVLLGWPRVLAQVAPHARLACLAAVVPPLLLGLAIGARFGPRRGGFPSTVSFLLVGASLVLPLTLWRLLPEERVVGYLVGQGPANGFVFSMLGLQLSADRLLLVVAAALGVGAALGASLAHDESSPSLSRIGPWLRLLPILVGPSLLWPLALGAASAPGAVRTLATLGVVTLVLGTVASRSIPLGLAALVAAVALRWLPPWLGLPLPPDESVLGFVEGPMGAASATRSADIGRLAASGTEPRLSLYAHGARDPKPTSLVEILMLLHASPSNVLLVSPGDTENARLALQDPYMREMTLVDADGSFLRLLEDLPLVGLDLLDQPKVRVDQADPRSVMANSLGTWDYVLEDASLLLRSPESVSIDRYRLVRRGLSAEGLYGIEIPTRALRASGFRVMLRSFLDVFPEAGFFTGRDGRGLLVGFMSLPSPRTLHLRAATLGPRIGWNAEERLLNVILASPSGLRAMAGARVATDDRPLDARELLVGPMHEGIESVRLFEYLAGQDLAAFNPVTELLRRSRSATAEWVDPAPVILPRRACGARVVLSEPLR